VRSFVFAGALALSAASVGAQQLPVIDMHLHALSADAQGPPPLGMCTPINPFPTWDQAVPFPASFIAMFKDPPCADPVWSPETDEALKSQTLDVVRGLNIYGVLSGSPARVADWVSAAPDRLWPGVLFQLGTPANTLTPDSLRRLHQTGRLFVFGEITNQYAGIAPDDERMEPYWALAEELEVPVGVHIGTGPPGAAYLGFDGYRGRLHSALTIEEVLIRHPTLRVYIMHAGYPMLDDLLTVLYAHPQVYVDIGIISYSQPRNAFYRYLKAIFDSGFGKRVMFGSDQMVWPGTIERAIQSVNEAPFLSGEQKRDILYNNAARFLRLDSATVAKHHRGGN
jgi:hypothetical protein